MCAHYFDVIRFSYCVVFKAGFVCVCIYVFFTQKTKKEGKMWPGVASIQFQQLQHVVFLTNKRKYDGHFML